MCFDVKIQLGKTRNDMRDMRAQGTSTVDDLVALYNLLDNESKMIKKQKETLKARGYRGPYLNGLDQPNWPNIMRALVS